MQSTNEVDRRLVHRLCASGHWELGSCPHTAALATAIAAATFAAAFTAATLTSTLTATTLAADPLRTVALHVRGYVVHRVLFCAATSVTSTNALAAAIAAATFAATLTSALTDSSLAATTFASTTLTFSVDSV